jgi:hypothetical protein
MTVRRGAFAMAGLAAAIVLSGCGGLDVDKAEKNIQNGLQSQGGKAIKAVSCPADVKKKEGETFQCTALTEDGQKLAVKVTETDGEGGIAWQTTGTSVASQTGPTGATGTTGANDASGPAGATKAQQPQTGATGGGEPIVLRFKTFRNRSGGYSVDYPAHWKQRGKGGDVSFTFAARFLHVVSQNGGPQTPAVLRKGVSKDKRTISYERPKAVRIPAGDAVSIEFKTKNGPTTTRIRRYSVSGRGKVFLIDFGITQGKDFNARFDRIIKRALRTFRPR